MWGKEQRAVGNREVSACLSDLNPGGLRDRERGKVSPQKAHLIRSQGLPVRGRAECTREHSLHP